MIKHIVMWKLKEVAEGADDIPDSDAVQSRMKQLAKILGVPKTEFAA